MKKIKKDLERHFRMIKGIMHQEDITLIKIYAPNREPEICKEITNATKRKNKLKHSCSTGTKYPSV